MGQVTAQYAMLNIVRREAQALRPYRHAFTLSPMFTIDRVIYAIHCHTHRNLPPPPLPTSPFRLPMMYVAPERPLKNSARAAGLSAGLPSTQVAWMIMALYMLLNSAILWRSSNSLRMYVCM
jgi:hypothetical protein